MSHGVRLKGAGVAREPWLDPWGNHLPKEVLAAISPTWDQPTWDRYLKSLEKPLKESYGLRADARLRAETFEIDRESAIHADARTDETLTGSDYYEQSEEEHPDGYEGLVTGLGQLTESEHKVVKEYYWGGHSEYGIARTLRVSRSTVQVLKRRAIESLHKHLSDTYPKYQALWNSGPSKRGIPKPPALPLAAPKLKAV